MEQLNFTVFPSEEKTIKVLRDPGYDDGVHDYHVNECVGFDQASQNHKYVSTRQYIAFVRKDPDGTVRPGLQSEQLALILMDRAEKLNKRFPSKQTARMIDGLSMFLAACRERVQDRMERNVMGEHKL